MEEPNASTPTSPRAKLFLLNLITLLVLWFGAWPLRYSVSERFYLVVPIVFALGAVWLLRLGQRRAAMIRLATCVALLMLILGMAIYEHYRPIPSFPSGELTDFARGFVAVLIVCSWIWTGVVAALKPILRVPADSKLSRRLLGQVVTILVFSLIITGYLMAVLQTHFPKRTSETTPAVLHRDFESVRFPSRDGLMLAGWFVRSGDSRRVAIVCHGVGAYKADMIDFIEALSAGGYNVLTFDFRGHGESEGHTVSYGKYEKLDIMAAVDWVRANHPEQSEHVVGVAWSMGAASMILASAEDERIEALHLDAAYARARDVAKIIAKPFPPVYEQCGLAIGLVLGSLESGANLYTLSPIDVVARIAPRPIMFIHGEADPLILLEQGEMLFAAAGEPKRFVVIPGAAHCQTIAVDTPRYEVRMVAFLDEALSTNGVKAARD